MSNTKRFYENILATVADAIYDECLDMPDRMTTTPESVYDSLWDALANSTLDQVYTYMKEAFTSEADMPKTAKAMSALEDVLPSKSPYEIAFRGTRYTAYVLDTPDGKTSDILAVFAEKETDSECFMDMVDWVFGASTMTDEDIRRFIKKAIKKAVKN